MFEMASLEDMERLERTVQRVFARVSYLEARVQQLERELVDVRDDAIPARVGEIENLHMMSAYGRTA